MYQANNYGYNPYGTYMPQRPMPQPMQPAPTVNDNLTVQPVSNIYKLNGKQVDSVDVVKAMDIPLDGSISYFPLTDGSAIVSKQLGMDGSSKIVVYKPIKEETKEQPKYLIADDLDDLREEIKDIRQEIKEMKKKKKSDIDE